MEGRDKDWSTTPGHHHPTESRSRPRHGKSDRFSRPLRPNRFFDCRGRRHPAAPYRNTRNRRRSPWKSRNWWTTGCRCRRRPSPIRRRCLNRNRTGRQWQSPKLNRSVRRRTPMSRTAIPTRRLPCVANVATISLRPLPWRETAADAPESWRITTTIITTTAAAAADDYD